MFHKVHQLDTCRDPLGHNRSVRSNVSPSMRLQTTIIDKYRPGLRSRHILHVHSCIWSEAFKNRYAILCFTHSFPSLSSGHFIGAFQKATYRPICGNESSAGFWRKNDKLLGTRKGRHGLIASLIYSPDDSSSLSSCQSVSSSSFGNIRPPIYASQWNIW